ncbi:membrane bound O-acyl transferase family-domain-containing protein [Mycena crocata]|nr:membrane bound O-acyl transferase family-domain-containing protein [Mycena crocata]
MSAKNRPFDLRVPLTFELFWVVFVPPVVLYYVTNVLAILGPKTFVYRLALLPVTLFAAWRTTVSLDIARGLHAAHPEKLDYMNQALVLAMFTVLTRALSRTFSSEVPQRLRRPSQSMVTTRTQLAWDAADLTFNLRGTGWNFSTTMKLPEQTRPIAPTSAFVYSTLGSLLLHILVFDFLHYSCQLFGPDTIGSTAGGSIYDLSSPYPYLRSTTITCLVGFLIYGAIQIGHDAFSLIGVTVFRQSPSEWPPIFDSPWFSTSLTEFWAARWHQVFRQDFITIGAKPLTLMAGRGAGVLGAFFMSGTLHYVGLWGMGKGSDVKVVFFFLFMGAGVITEGCLKRFLGIRVHGWLGWIWSCAWIVGFGHLMADPWCRSGLMGSVFLPQAARPSVLFHKLVTAINFTSF